MKIAVLSDIHDNVWNLNAALAFLRDSGATDLLCCGDLCAPFIVGLLRDGFPGRIHIVFGNNDADLYRITRQEQPGRVDIHGEIAELFVASEQLLTAKELDDAGDAARAGALRIAVQHYDTIGRPLAASGAYDVVFYGHNHFLRYERGERGVAINPGAIMGYKGPERRDIPATFVLYDSAGRTPTWYEVVTSAKGDTVTRSVRAYEAVAEERLAL